MARSCIRRAVEDSPASESASFFRSLAKRPALCSPAAAHEFPQVIAGVSGECARSSPMEKDLTREGGLISRAADAAVKKTAALRLSLSVFSETTRKNTAC